MREMLLNKHGVDNDDRENTNVEANDNGFLFDEIVREEVSTKIPEAIASSPNMVAKIENDVSPVVGVQEGCETGDFLLADYSPETMEKLENVLQDLDEGHLNKRQKEVVAEGEVFVGEVADEVVEPVGEKVSEKIPQYADKVPEGATNQEEVEPIFNSTDLFGPEVEKPIFKINEVIAPDLNLGIARSAEEFVLHVTRELYEIHAPYEPNDDLETAFEKSMDVDMKDSGVVKSKVVLLRNDGGSGTSGLGKVTPAVPKRKIKLPSYLRSPFLQHFGSSAKEGLEPAKLDSLKGLCPFDDNIGNLPDMDLSEHFYNWLDARLVMKKNRKKFYSKEDNTSSPPFNLGSELISEKMWFHTIEYGSSNLSNSHVNVFFYYLRKLSKYGLSCEMKFTSTDCNFQKNLVSTCGLIAEYEDIESTFSANQDVLDVINGYSLAFSTPWYSVDYVLFPIWLPEQKYWLVVVLNFHKRIIRVHNTLSCEGITLIVKKALLPLCMLLPHYLLLTDFYSRTDINFSDACYTGKSKTDVLRLVMHNDYSAGTSIDSGVLMISIAEYFVRKKDFPEVSFDIACHRSRIAYSFYSYAIAKQINGYETEPEYLANGDGHGLGKRTRGGMVQTRKRKMGKV
ncbi:hypothetical protein POM88_022496 [Heracleum sosnowskyi]|uniref:Ubiquitin-like protease family profile domain-containing protein n=1 Tax=Heracleum sosnowskyi TaxID=360622 RepID=A0AAD8IGY8_9APIA|nr:hypothetical protein POM88_022496 [Heracleum sosnowskyi]